MTLLSILRPVGLNQAGTSLIADTFDADTTGQDPPTGWTRPNAGAYSIQPTPAALAVAGKSIQVTASTTIDDFLVRTFTRQSSGEVRFRWRVLTPSTTASTRSGIMQVLDSTGTYLVQVGPLNGVWVYGNGTGTVNGSTGSWAVNTAYTVEVTIDLDHMLFKFQVDATGYDNAGAWWAMDAGVTGIDRMQYSAYSPAGGTFYLDDVYAASLVPTAAPPTGTGTLSMSGTFDGVTLGTDRYGRVILGYANADTAIATVKVERSADNSTWVDISGSVRVQATGTGRWTITDKRPQYGSQSTTYGGTVYYRISGRNSGGSSPTSVSGAMVAQPDRAAYETARFAYLHGVMGGAAVPTSQLTEAYPTYWINAMTYAYAQTGNATYLTDVSTQFSYVQSLTDGTAGVIQFPDYNTAFFRDHHWRTIYHCALSSRLLRRSGALTLADSMIAQCDTWVSSFYANMNGGTSRSTITRSGFDANNDSGTGNQQPWQATHAYAIGDVVKTPSGNARTYRATVAGTSAGVGPTWPVTAGGTVTDGGVTWTETTVTGGVTFSDYSDVAPYTGTAGQDLVDVNQIMEEAAALALLLTDPSSALFTAGATRTAALSHLTDATTLASAYQTSTGALPIGDTFPAVNGAAGYDTLYGNYGLEVMSVVLRFAPGLVNQWLQQFASGGINWLNSSYGTEPIGTMHYSGSTATTYSEVVMRAYASLLLGKTYPFGGLRYTPAVNFTTDERIGDYDPYGNFTPYVDAQQARVFQADLTVKLFELDTPRPAVMPTMRAA